MGVIEQLQEMLTEEYMSYCNKKGKRRVSDNEFARYLGVSPASFNQWINGSRVPSLENAAILARTLGPRVFDILGFPEVTYIKNPDLQYIIRNWKYLDNETQQQILDHIAEIADDKTGGQST